MVHPQWYYVKMLFFEIRCYLVTILGFLILIFDTLFIGLQKKLYKGPFKKFTDETDFKAEEKNGVLEG